MPRDCNGTHARASPTVGDTERLVEIDVTYVRPVVTRAAQTHLRVHVCAVQVDLSSSSVHDLADFANCCFENPVGRRIGDHQGGQP